jgi:hypothetical protein
MAGPIKWSIVAPGLAVAMGFAGVAMRMDPPAVIVAARCTTFAAILLTVKLVAWVAQCGHRFQREERLVTFVLFACIVLSWIGVQEKISEAAFDHLVAVQTKALIVGTQDLSREILAFVDERAREAPPPPSAASWDRDFLAVEQFETQTVDAYEQRFGNRVRTAHDLLTFRNMRSRDLDAFYRRPSNPFQIRVTAQALDGLAGKLARQTESPHQREDGTPARQPSPLVQSRRGL